jgi:hypothetical protein
MLKRSMMLMVCTLSVAMYTSCSGEEPVNIDEDMFEVTDTDVTPMLDVPPEVLEEIITAIPTPVEMNVMIRASGAEYYGEILHPAADVEQYTTSYKKALNLGIYGADLGYLNIYEKTGTSIDYLKSIKDLSDDLRIGEFFDFAKLQELAADSENSDSLIIVSTKNFNKMNRHLREDKRGKVSVLIIVGTFVEGLNIAGQIVKNNPNDEIVEKIGEQKLTVSDLLTILQLYGEDPEMGDLIADFEDLKLEMDDVEILITVGERVATEVDGRLVFEDSSTSEILLTDETLSRIIAKTEAIRQKIIS